MRRLRYSINVTLDGCGDHTVFMPGPDVHEHAAAGIARADGILLGRATYDLMEQGWRAPALPGVMPAWTSTFRDTINAARKYLVSSTPPAPGWNTQVLQGDLRTAVQQLKQSPGGDLAVGGIRLPLALAEWDLIDDYEFVVHPRLVGHGPWIFAGLPRPLDLRPVDRVELEGGIVATQYEVIR
jgi:dihydrofolate reductase